METRPVIADVDKKKVPKAIKRNLKFNQSREMRFNVSSFTDCCGTKNEIQYFLLYFYLLNTALKLRTDFDDLGWCSNILLRK